LKATTNLDFPNDRALLSGEEHLIGLLLEFKV